MASQKICSGISGKFKSLNVDFHCRRCLKGENGFFDLSVSFAERGIQ